MDLSRKWLRTIGDRILRRMKYWEIIGDRPGKAGFSLGCVSTINSNSRTIWIVDAHRGDGRRFMVRADKKLSAFVNSNVSTSESKPSMQLY